MALVTSTCPACGTRVKGESDVVGKKVRCRRCGETFRFGEETHDDEEAEADSPAEDSRQDARAREPGGSLKDMGKGLSARGAKGAAAPFISDGETMLYYSTPSLLLLIKCYLPLGFFLALLYLPLLLVPFLPREAALRGGVPVGTLFLITLIFLLIGVALYLNWAKTVYILTDKQAIARHGILSLRVTRIPLRRVQQVSFTCGLLERLFGLGTLVLISGGFWGVRWRTVPQAQELAKFVSQVISSSYSPR